MSKITVNQAVELVDVSRATLYKDITEGKVSAEKDERGKKVVDPAELERVYGKLGHPNPKGRPNGHPNPSEAETSGRVENASQVVQILENQVQDLKAQLTQANARETVLLSDKSKLLDMLSVEQEKTRVLMLPDPDRKASSRKPNPGWLGYFRLRK